ncbi:MAG: hypothetical protein CFE21_00130 [Bacteroidetes bacterium B1(2017)]|nr:MAG: hypothetical protein CFE21_00130 [Bacteroidetes bacterium B1(2017)]
MNKVFIKKRLLKSVLLVALLFSIGLRGYGQVAVTVTGNTNTSPSLSASYVSLASAITALNTVTSFSGPVTLTCATSGTETAPAGGYSISFTGATTATNKVVIDGAGSSITANASPTAGNLNDAIFKIIGSDYVIIKSFSMYENANTTTTAASNNMTEWGVALIYSSTTNGAQNCTIQGCTIDLNRTYQNSFGIYSNSTHSASAPTTSATATTTAGGNSGLTIIGNTITDVNQAISVVGPTAAADNNDGLTIGGSLANANTITNYGTTGTFSAYANVSGTVNGILVRNTKNFTISYNSITSSNGGTTAGTLRGIFVPAFTNAPTGTIVNVINNNSISARSAVTAGVLQGITVETTTGNTTTSLSINSNDFSTFGHTVAASGAITFISDAMANLTTTISSNTFTNMSVNTTGAVVFIGHTFSIPTTGSLVMNSNSIVTGFTRTSAGSTTLTTCNSTSGTGAICNYTNNNFSNITLTGSSTTIGFNNTDGGTGSTKTITGNTFNNWSGTTSTINCMNFTYWNGVSSLSNNTITNITGQSTITGVTIGATANNATSIAVSGNTINNLSSTGTGGSVTGISSSNTSTLINFYSNTIHTLSSTSTSGTITGISILGGGTTINIYKNKIYNLSGNQAGTLINGISVTSGTLFNIYNNIIGDLKATAATGLEAIKGINFTATATANLYYNTIYLNASSSSVTTFGTSCVSFSSTTTAFNLRNNILINLSVPGSNGSNLASNGISACIRRSSGTAATVPSNYSTTSNNNLFWCDPSSGTNNHTTYVEGTSTITNSMNTFALMKTFMANRDQVSVSENPSFASTTGSNSQFLELSGSTPTQGESGGAAIASYEDDYNTAGSRTPATYPKTGQVNGGGSNPDIGAIEGDYQLADLTAPVITYTALVGTSSTMDRTLTATITDASGVPTSGMGMPVLYWKINGGPYSAVTSVWVSGTTYTFTFGNGVLPGDVVSYYVVAQDNAGSPNVGSFPVAGASGPTNNPPAFSAPPTTPSTYTILNTISGSFNVGASQTYATLTAAFTDIASKDVTGAITLNLMSDYTGSEPAYPVVIPTLIGVSVSNTITVMPDASISSAITITSANTTATLYLNGAKYVTFDGRPGGTGSNKYLIIQNTSATAAAAGNAILLANESSNNTFTYLDIKAANENLPTSTAISTVGAVPGAIAIGTTSGSNGNDNNSITYCDIHSTGANLGACVYAGNATTAGLASNNDYNTISNNNLYDFFMAGSANCAVIVGLGNNNFTLNDNKVYQTATRTYTSTQTVRGFWITPNIASLTSASGFVINNNIIGYANSTSTGTYTMTGATAYNFYGMDISVGTGAATSVQNNTITNMNITGAYTGNAVYGINVANGNVNVGTVTGNLIGSTTVNGAITVTTTAAAAGTFIGLRSGAGGTINFSNNTISGIDLIANATTATNGFNGIAGSGGATLIINNNVVGSATLANSINVSSTSSTSTTAQAVRGIICNSATGGVVNTITNNLVANINTNYNSTGSQATTLVGIAVTTGSSTISGNTVRNLTSATQTTSGGSTCSVLGISYTSTTANAVISGNTLHTIKNTNNATSAAIQVDGIYYGGPTSGTNLIEKNSIHSVSLSSATATGGYVTGMDIASGLLTIKNNMLRLGYDESGASITAACTVRGITKNTASSNIYNNSIYIGGTGVGTTATNTFALVKSGAPVSADDWRNNILVNNRSNATTGGKHYPIYLSATTSLTLNANIYNGSGTGFTFAYNGTADVSAYGSGWVSGDVASLTSDPQFINATGTSSTGDLHINTGIASGAESFGVAIAGVTDDIDGNVRYSNVGYAGTGTAYDIGADEMNGTPLAFMTYASSTTVQQTGSTYAGQSNQSIIRMEVVTTGATSPISATSFTVNANGSSAIGDITSAKIYYTGASTTFSTNSLFGTNGTPSTSNFNITGTQALSEGSNYFWLAFDINASATSSNLIDAEFNSVTVAGSPQTPSVTAPSGSKSVVGAMTGNYDIGSGQVFPNFTTITNAITDLGLRGVSGPVTFTLLDANYSSGETFPITIPVFTGASGTNTVTIKPGTGVTSTITGSSSSSIIKLNGADYVIIDGSNNGTTSKNLTITNSATAAPTVIHIASLGVGAGSTYNTVKNCNISTGVNSTIGYGVSISGSTSGSAGDDNDNITIQNNAITEATIGIYANGNAAVSGGGMDNLSLIGNSITYTTTLTSVYGIRVGNAIGANVNQNTINIETSAANIIGISLEAGFNTSTVNANLISKVKSTALSIPIVRGIVVGSAQTGSAITISNNVIYNVIAAYATTNVGSNCSGIMLGATGVGTTYSIVTGGVNLYYNSINLYGTVDRNAGTTEYGIFIGSAVTSVDCRNNAISNTIVNGNVSGTASKSYAIYCQSANTAFTSINYNVYYVGATQGVLGFLTSDRTDLAGIQSGFGSNVNSVTALPQFASSTNLIPNLGSPLLAGGTFISGVTTDYSGTTRSGSTPSIGAYENGADLSGPTISYTTLGNTISTSNRDLLSVTITDASSVNTTAGTKPRIYYKLSTNANAYVGNTSSDNGWKYVESSSSSSPFDFTIDVSLLNGGPLVSGSIVQYFVVAQDLAATPNVSLNSGAFAATPSSVDLTSGAFPIGGSINSYMVSPSYSGSYDVGSGAPVYTTLKSFFDALNAGVVTGNITVNIIGNCTETATATLNQISEEPVSSNFTVTINPSGGARVISGNIAGAIIKLYGADRVTIDGLNTGGNSLSISNTNSTASSSVIWLSSLGTGLGATNNTLTNLTVTGGLNSVIYYGVALSGSTIASAGADNDNNTISNSVFGTSSNAIYVNGNANVATGGVNDLLVSANTVSCSTTIAAIGIELLNVVNSTISQNSFDIQQSATGAPVALSIETGSNNILVSKNTITRSFYTASGGYAGRGITVGTGNATSAITISNNVIYGVGGDNFSGFGNSSAAGIMLGTIGGSSTLTTVAGGINLYNNTVSMAGTYTRTTACITSALYIGTGVTVLDIRNNIFSNSLNNLDLTTGAGSKAYAIYSAYASSGSGAFSSINNNDYFVSGSQGVLSYINGADVLTLTALKTAFGSNALSYNQNPGFTSTSNLLPVLNAFPNNYMIGVAIGSVTTDIAGTTRSTPPDIGAYEGAEANRWIGSTSTAWSTASNWDNGAVPSGAQNITIADNASNSATLSGNTDANNLYITSGKILTIGSNTLTINNTISGTGTISVTGGNITIGGSGSFGTLNFDQTTPGTTNRLANLTVDRIGQTITLGNAVQVSGVVTPTAGTIATGGNLTLLSTATSDASIAAGSGSYLTGAVTVQRFVPGTSGRKYRYLAAPFTSGPTIANSWQQQIHITGSGTGGTACPSLTAHTNGFDASTYNNESMLIFDEVNATATLATPTVSGGTVYTNAWAGIANTNVLTLSGGKGYNVFVRGARSQGCGLLDGTNPTPSDVTLSATGTVATGNFSIPVTYNASNGQGWNLVGNPYPSAIDWNAGSWTKTNVDASIWIYRPSTDQFAVYNGVTGTNGGSNIIPSGQGFFVKANASSPVLSVTEAAKTSSYPSPLLLKNKPFEIRMSLLNANGKSDESILALNRDLTDEFDHEFDAEKMNNPSNVNVYTIDANGIRYAINAIANIEDETEKVVPMGIGSATAGTYTMSISSGGLPNYYQLFLRDHFLHSETQIMDGNGLNKVFTVTSDPASFGNTRFDLFIKNNRPHSTGLTTVASKTEITVFPNPSNDFLTISLKQNAQKISSFALYNSLGQLVDTLENPKASETVDLSKLESGVYFLQALSQTEVVKTIKVVKN